MWRNACTQIKGNNLNLHFLCQRIAAAAVADRGAELAQLKGYGHSMKRFAYFLMMLSSANIKSDLLTVRQFCRWGTGLYRAMVRARCALACFMDAVSPAAAASCPSPLRSKSPSPQSPVAGADSSPNRAILQRNDERTPFVKHYRRDAERREQISTFKPRTASRAPRFPKSYRIPSLHATRDTPAFT